MKSFGKYPSPRRFTPPPATRGGYPSAFNRKSEAPLTGIVQNQKAAQGEERLTRTLDKSIRKGIIRYYYFRNSPGLPKGLPGWKELDLLVVGYGRNLAISVKGVDFVHKGASAKEKDKLNELIILARLRTLGFDIPEITTVRDADLETQELADRVGRNLGVYR